MIHLGSKMQSHTDSTALSSVCFMTRETTSNAMLYDFYSRLGIDISVKKPPPDLSLGCPCGDAECKKKKCDPPKPKKFATCDQRNGKAKQMNVRSQLKV